MNLNQVTIASNDVANSVEFYSRLGLRLIVDSVPRYARFECPNGDATFSIHRVETNINPSGTVVYFECEDLDERVKELQSQGVEFESEPKDQRWLWREARLNDPSGNQIILFLAGDNRKNPPWRVDTETNSG